MNGPQLSATNRSWARSLGVVAIGLALLLLASGRVGRTQDATTQPPAPGDTSTESAAPTSQPPTTQPPTTQPGGDAGSPGPPTGDATDDSSAGDPEETTGADTTAAGTDTADAGGFDYELWTPVVILILGIAIVLGLIIGFKVNAFIALITAAIVVSLMAPGDVGGKIKRVAEAFGGTAGGIGIVIALAAVIGKCMLDSGAADRIVRAFVKLLGEKRAPLALMGSGYVLSVPVFFDTVFYLLVPLARSLHRRTGVQYLKYILAISAGGALTHSLVPPTPGPLLMASTLNVDLGMMILIGALVAAPAALVGVLFAHFADKMMQTPMRPIPGMEEPEPLEDNELPSLGLSLLPVILPVVLITANTVMTTLADLEPSTQMASGDIANWDALSRTMEERNGPSARPGIAAIFEALPTDAQVRLDSGATLTDEDQAAIVAAFNQVLRNKRLYDPDRFVGVRLREGTRKLVGADMTRAGRAQVEHRNRSLLEDVFNGDPDEPILKHHTWRTTRRQAAEWTSMLGNANLALLLSTVIAVWVLARQRELGKSEIAVVVEQSLMSAGVIILITSGGGAFGAMLKAAEIGNSIETLFGDVLSGGGNGLAYLCLGFAIACVLKVAQGSGTVAMIVGSSMMSAIVGETPLGFHPVYLATAIGAGSLVGSWMNDSGFWIFAKMGGLTETEALKSWTLLLVVLGLASFGVTLVMAMYLPLAPVAS